MFPILSFGQKRGGRETLTVREWEKGPLRKEEFTVSPQGDSASFSVIWLEKTARVKVGSAIYQYFDVLNAFLPGNTVIGKEGLTEDLLQSFQEQFDLSEYCARKLRDAYLMTPGWKRKDLRSRAFEKSTLLRDSLATGKFSFGNLPPENFDPSHLPKVSPFGISAFAGAECFIPMGAMSGLTSPNLGICYGLEMSYGRFYLDAWHSWGKGRYVGNYLGVGGDNGVYHSDWRLAPGFIVAEKGRWNLSLFVAGGHSRVTVSGNETVQGLSFAEGLRCDFRFWKKFYLSRAFPVLYQAGLSSRVYVGQLLVAQNNTISPSLNVSLSLNVSRHGLSRL